MSSANLGKGKGLPCLSARTFLYCLFKSSSASSFSTLGLLFTKLVGNSFRACLLAIAVPAPANRAGVAVPPVAIVPPATTVPTTAASAKLAANEGTNWPVAEATWLKKPPIVGSSKNSPKLSIPAKGMPDSSSSLSPSLKRFSASSVLPRKVAMVAMKFLFCAAMFAAPDSKPARNDSPIVSTGCV